MLSFAISKAKDLTTNKLEGITKNIVIIGVPKCGQNSLFKYLLAKYPNQDVAWSELIWKPQQGMRMMAKAYKDYQPIVILRKRVERIWSSYHCFGMYRTHSLEEYLQFDKPSNLGAIGEGNPMYQSDYAFWIKNYEQFNPIIVWLEDCIGLEGFPHENKGIEQRPNEYPEITIEERQLIEEYL